MTMVGTNTRKPGFEVDALTGMRRRMPRGTWKLQNFLKNLNLAGRSLPEGVKLSLRILIISEDVGSSDWAVIMSGSEGRS